MKNESRKSSNERVTVQAVPAQACAIWVASVDLKSSKSKLTPAELAVALLAAAGATNADIARARRTSLRTVANQMASVFQKLGVRRRRMLRVVVGGECATRSR